MPKLVAVAGATGYTGQRILEYTANHATWRSRALVRNRNTSATFPTDQDVVQCQLDDVASLTNALEGCEAIIQTIGTTKAQFGPGVNYETVDYGTTVALLKAANAVGIRRFVLLSSLGAGRPFGEYLHWKARTEQAVQATNLDWVIVRPAAIVGEGRRSMQRWTKPINWLSKVPWLGPKSLRYQSIEVQDLAKVLVAALDLVVHHQILEGETLWKLVGHKASSEVGDR